MKNYIIAGFAAFGAFAVYQHFTKPQVKDVPVGFTPTPRVDTDSVLVKSTPVDLIGCRIYGFVGEGSVTPREALYQKGLTDKQMAIVQKLGA